MVCAQVVDFQAPSPAPQELFKMVLQALFGDVFPDARLNIYKELFENGIAKD